MLLISFFLCQGLGQIITNFVFPDVNNYLVPSKVIQNMRGSFNNTLILGEKWSILFHFYCIGPLRQNHDDDLYLPQKHPKPKVYKIRDIYLVEIDKPNLEHLLKNFFITSSASHQMIWLRWSLNVEYLFWLLIFFSQLTKTNFLCQKTFGKIRFFSQLWKVCDNQIG